MLSILLHSSKSMRTERLDHAPLDRPALPVQAAVLSGMIKNRLDQIGTMMHLSESKTAEVQSIWRDWSLDPDTGIPAIDAFIGDIYSGLQVHKWSDQDRAYAHRRLLILSGLYGVLRACDGIRPYRLEMGHTLPTGVTLYSFWRQASAKMIAVMDPATSTIINLSAVEYTKAFLPHTDVPVVSPKFLTVSQKTGQPVFVTVHAKIARGAFAHWLIKNRISDTSSLTTFSELGYEYNHGASTPAQPVFVCKRFEGLGLSVRLR